LFALTALASFGQGLNCIAEVVVRWPINLLSLVVVAGLCSCKGEGSRSETGTKPASEMSGTQTQAPSFDCSRSLSQSEKIICEDQQLALLDREAARLLELAISGPQATQDRSRSLREGHQLWLKGRDDCVHSRNTRECLTAAYAQRIYELRREFPDLRGANASGISRGPLQMECEGWESGVSVAFLDAEPDLVYFEWMENFVVLPRVPSESGAKYSGQFRGQTYSFWTKGSEAQFQRPGSPEAKCRLKEIK
jgi:uncharacterized protein